jgi:hypothetical protein
MNKRSAMTVAAGLVFALMVGAAAVAVGATGPGPSGGSDEAQRAQPHVRTITRTVEVQRASGDPSTAGSMSTTPVSPLPAQGSSDDGWEDDHEDEEYEEEDEHEDDDGDRWNDDDDHGDDD